MAVDRALLRYAFRKRRTSLESKTLLLPRRGEVRSPQRCSNSECPSSDRRRYRRPGRHRGIPDLRATIGDGNALAVEHCGQRVALADPLLDWEVLT
jgi:hypothetical protein